MQLEIEYAPELPGPSLTSQHESPDWISAIAGATPGYFFSACYDGSIRSFSASGEVVDSFRAHAKPLASIAVHTSATDATSHTVVTGSKDQRIRAWNVSTGSKASHTAIFDGLGHGSSVQAVSIARHGRQCVSGGWDGSLLVWDLPRSAEQARQSAGYVEVDDSAAGGDGGGKRQRGGGAADVSAGTDNKTPSFQPITRLTGHKQAVGGVQWVSDREVVTGSWDHSVCLWDLSRGGEPVQTLVRCCLPSHQQLPYSVMMTMLCDITCTYMTVNVYLMYTCVLCVLRTARIQGRHQHHMPTTHRRRNRIYRCDGTPGPRGSTMGSPRCR